MKTAWAHSCDRSRFCGFYSATSASARPLVAIKTDRKMTDIEKLITSARHYCKDNFVFWADKYQKESSGNNNPYSDNDYNTFPRYNVLTAIQQGVETLVGQEFQSFENCKEQLADIGLKSHSIFTIDNNAEIHLLGESGKCKSTTGRQNPIAKNAMTEERTKFIEFINSRTTKNISQVEPMPYRRRLTDKEMLSVRKQLLDIWNFDGDYWNPLDDKSPKETIFLMEDNLTDDDNNKIIDFITSNSNKRIFEITEDRIDYELELDSFDLNLYETIITDKTYSWIIYGSHEDTLTFGGTELVDFIKTLFLDRQEKLNKWEQNW